MSEDKSLEENFETANARITPGVTIGGMGEVSLPNADNGNIGSGDVPDVADIDDDEEEAKKDKTKKKLEMEGFKLFTQFNNFVTEGEEVAESDKIYEEAILENAVRDLHFETDPKKAEELKIEIGASQGEVTRRKQIEGGDYSLRRFRKEIKYDETGEDLGVFKPGSYMAATSKLGDGPHKKAAKKVRWNQKMYDQWIEDVASNGGWQYAFDMAQNAKHERGLIDWVKKNHRGEDPMQRIQWDIEAFAESTVTEAKEEPIEIIDEGVLSNVRKAVEKTKKTLKNKWAKKGGYENFGQDEIRDLEDKYDYNSMVYGTPEERKAAKLIDSLDQWAMNYVGESTVTEAKEEPIVALLKLGLFASKGTGEKKLLRLSDDFEEIGDEQADEIASHLNMAIELFQDGYSKAAVPHFKKFNKACKDELALMKKQGLAESAVTEKLARGLKPLLTIGSTITKKAGEDALLDLSDKFDRIDDEYAGTIASWLDMAIELMQDGYAGDATKKLKQFNKKCKDVLNGKDIGSAFESVTKDHFSEFCKLNEAKSVDRDEMMKWIKKSMDFVGTSEDFNGSQGGIHVSGEAGDEYKGAIIYSYYSEDYKNREFGVWNKWEKELNKRGWYSEWYDAGTVCIWPL